VGDFVAKYGIFSGVGGLLLLAAIPLVVRYLRRQHPTAAALPSPIQPLEVEVVPLWFEVSLSQQIPDVRVWVQVVNYLSRELRLSDVTATYCHINQGPPLENIPGGELRIPGHRSWQIMCRRTLLDAETKVFHTVPWRDQFEGNLHVRIRGTAGKKPIALDLSGFAMRGWITGLPSHPSLKRAPTA